MQPLSTSLTDPGAFASDRPRVAASLMGMFRSLKARLLTPVEVFSFEESAQEPMPTPRTQAAESPYLAEVRNHLDTVAPLAKTTLRHLLLQNMQVFTAERDSPLLKRLARLNLLHPMGSSAYPAHAYPYRVPDVVWAELKRRYAAARR